MNIPANLKYTKSHEWVELLDGAKARVGLTDFAQSALGSVVFVNLPEPGDSLEVGGTIGDVESVKAVSDVFSPVAGTVSAINEELLDSPENINQAPYEAWFVEVEEVSAQEELMTAGEYEVFCAEDK